MSQEWIKMRTNLERTPEVWSIMQDTGLDAFGVVGRLHAVWSWFDEMTEDGNAIGVTKALIERITGVSGFGDSMEKVDWLSEKDGVLIAPRFEKHNGNTAKKRAVTLSRVKKHRRCNASSVTTALPEQEREQEKSTSTHTQQELVETPPAGAPVTEQQAMQAAEQRGFPGEIGRKWWLKCEENLWRNKDGVAIGSRNWSPSIQKFCLTHQEISQQNSSRQNSSRQKRGGGYCDKDRPLWAIENEIKECEKRIREAKGEVTGAWGELSDDARIKIKRDRARIKELENAKE